MLQRVRNDWIDGVLDQSLYKVARIELHLEDVSQVVERPWHVEGRVLDEEPRELSPGNSMAMIFEQFGGALLILGAPGSGKTTVLLELARDLLAKAQQDESYPI